MAGGPYNIPRNTKGETRFFGVFSVKALIFTAILGGGAFIIAYPISAIFNKKIIGMGITVFFGFIGFAVSSFKIPESNNFEITRNAGGEYLDKIITRYIKFKKKRNKIYTFYNKKTEDKTNG